MNRSMCIISPVGPTKDLVDQDWPMAPTALREDNVSGIDLVLTGVDSPYS